MDMPVYLITGFLESGKTSFIIDTISDPDFCKGEKTLLLVCEEGIEEYDEKRLKKANTVMELLETNEDFNEKHLDELVKKHRPTRVMMEYNGVWSLRDIAQKAPKSWVFYQIIMFVNADTFDVYIQNMRQLISDNMAIADMVIFNRCDREKTDKKMYRRTVKALNPAADIIFEYADGTVDNGFREEMPFDKNAPVIDIVHDDFGLWYIDIMDNLKDYKNKSVCVRGIVFKNNRMPKGYFVISRRAMTCCADDIQVIGILVKSAAADGLKNGEWIEATGKIIGETHPQYRGEGPVLVEAEITPTQPAKSEVVTFS